MLRYRLVPHPDSPSTAIERIEVTLASDAREWCLAYRLIGAAERVVARRRPSGEPPHRRDELWRSTCCELFVRDADGAGYLEYNFAPCGGWAAYRFSAYRAGRDPLDTPAPRLALERRSTAIELAVTLKAPALGGPGGPRGLDGRIGLACIVETDAEISYWALAHAPGKPDFHHATSFASRSPATLRAAQSGA